MGGFGMPTGGMPDGDMPGGDIPGGGLPCDGMPGGGGFNSTVSGCTGGPLSSLSCSGGRGMGVASGLWAGGAWRHVRA
jgi:hypothetical protein